MIAYFLLVYICAALICLAAGLLACLCVWWD